jgi:PKHD-type hydroxylase
MTEENTNKYPAVLAWPFQKYHVQEWAYWDTLFSKVECEKIIEIGNALPTIVASTASPNKTDTNIRDSHVSWISPSAEMGWIFERIAGAVLSLNQQFFGFDLYGMIEGLQFTKYEAPSGHYRQHVDSVFGIATRKVSVSIQLNPSEEFEGGRLLLYKSAVPIDPELVQGKLVAFPSYTLHEVTPVTKGTRYSLVCWITGAPFR